MRREEAPQVDFTPRTAECHPEALEEGGFRRKESSFYDDFIIKIAKKRATFLLCFMGFYKILIKIHKR